jgi:glycerophosphoryl diester phosphodiesterase
MLGSVQQWFSSLFKRCPDKRKSRHRGREFFVIGHRGSPCDEVENTLPSFQTALDRDKANGLEFDLCMTADGRIVVWHDWCPDDLICKARCAGLEPDVKHCPWFADGEQRRSVHEWTYHEFINYHGYADKSDPQIRVDATIPTLDEVVQWGVGREDLRIMFFDIKIPESELALVPRMMGAIEDILRRYMPSFDIVFETAFPSVLEAMKRCLPHRTFALDIEPSPGIVLRPASFSAMKPALAYDNTFATVQRPRPVIIAPWTTHKRIVRHDIRLRDRYVAKKMNVVSFTINDEQEMRCLIAMGVDGIQSDRPGMLRTIVDGMGVPIGPLSEKSSDIISGMRPLMEPTV